VKSALPCVLTVNAGSSSIRFAVYEAGATLRQRIGGKIDRIGLRGTNWVVTGPSGKLQSPRPLAKANHRTAVSFLLDWLEAQPIFPCIKGAGQRVVHGKRHSDAKRVTPELLTELHRIAPYAPDHMPRELALIEALRQRHPKLPQVACFDTAFHRTMPPVARLMPIPRRYAAKGVERYGFHGLSFTFLMEELGRTDPAAAHSRVILAHLGNGASLAAVRDGKSIDTSMGFTPMSGLVMGTRCGDLDPGLAYYLARTDRMSAAKFQNMVAHESGLLGVSGTSSDVRDLLAREVRDRRASDAVALFCYQAKKWIGSYAAALGGLDTLVFAGGIGENAPSIRERICDGLGFLGIELDRTRNAQSGPLISLHSGRVKVRVIRTNEELMIARSASRVLALGTFPET
jgi:acetate kinase